MTFKELMPVLGSYYRCRIYSPRSELIGGYFDVDETTGEGVDYAKDLAEMNTEIILIDTDYSESHGWHMPVVVYKILDYMDLSHKPIMEFYTYKKFGLASFRAQRFICPNCGEILNAGPHYQPNFAPDCGCALDWSDIKFVAEERID